MKTPDAAPERWHPDCLQQGCIKGLHGGGHCAGSECSVLHTRSRPKKPVAASGHVVTFVEHGTHKTIGALNAPSMSGTIRVSDQATIDYLREAFEKAGWEVEDV